MSNEKVKEYYDYTLPFYRLFWHGSTRAVHYGIWDETTKTLKDALLNTNRVMADAADIASGDEILDAGCGVGGSSFWLVQNRDVRIHGITISPRQLNKAVELSERLGLANRVSFSLQDYTHTNFPDSSFDVVWALESACHAIDKSSFLKEAFRLLKPSGRLVVGDGFLEKTNLGPDEYEMFQNFLTGLSLHNLAEAKTFEELLKSIGFKNVRSMDKTEEILPTSEAMAKMSRWGLPLSKFTARLGLTPQLLEDNNRAGIDQLRLFKNRVLTYRIFVAQK
jgi:cyclopropane fatty-acyl-phospholipid synthase-like methyltransferase